MEGTGGGRAGRRSRSAPRMALASRRNVSQRAAASTINDATGTSLPSARPRLLRYNVRPCPFCCARFERVEVLLGISSGLTWRGWSKKCALSGSPRPSVAGAAVASASCLRTLIDLLPKGRDFTTLVKPGARANLQPEAPPLHRRVERLGELVRGQRCRDCYPASGVSATPSSRSSVDEFVKASGPRRRRYGGLVPVPPVAHQERT